MLEAVSRRKSNNEGVRQARHVFKPRSRPGDRARQILPALPITIAPNAFWWVFMGLGGLFKKIFSSSAAIPVDVPALSSTNENALASSLEKLADGERRWIPLTRNPPLLDGRSAKRVLVNLTMPARTGSRRLQRNIGAHRTSGRPKVASTSARTTERKLQLTHLSLTFLLS
jgi:hypothetical protein